MEWRQTEPDDKEKDDVESAISKHQADIPVLPDNSTDLCTVIQLSLPLGPFTYDSVKTCAHCSGVVINTLSLIQHKPA